ncbi:hypothetical protein SDC9_207685 [bioreactor metagenome]|uniref:Uncharacterized protein n=1 Tax=bioreactor metagenome TaxID=1076179 RepID=A0A645JA22_9ZZZZ
MRELLSFVRNARGRAEAENGAHDDLVMALAIALYIMPECAERPPEEQTAHVRWTADMWEDYENSDDEGKKYLIAKYGKP